MTTNNHPAHGPVSLDRLHQISEILSKAAAQSDGGNLGYAMADAVKVIDGAIAAFGADPVAWKLEYRDKCYVTNDQRRAKIVADDGEVLVQPLYTATPSPVSLPLAIHDDDFEKALSVLNDTLDDCGDSERGLLLALDRVGIEVRSVCLPHRHASGWQLSGNSGWLDSGKRANAGARC
ncbi:hypothetical protein RQM08_09705 [Citrobacter freundii]|uniref:hypothetical protein n=1 Tax=Citrobacter freundii TaxID=546 RepID=UPI0028BF421E|nr:hypothetical protein [Citrobacter freundii]MDT7324849.1 hypothetical protein [Citrobacter freundii]